MVRIQLSISWLISVAKAKTAASSAVSGSVIGGEIVTRNNGSMVADRAGVEMPIIDATYRILFEGQAPREAVAELMARELRAERD